MSTITIIDVRDAAGFGRLPPCADPGFDHRSCDYWEDADRGSKQIRLKWLEPATAAASPPPRPAANPFAEELATRKPVRNPFAPSGGSKPAWSLLADDGDDVLADNPFAPRPPDRGSVGMDAPPKLRLLGRGLTVFGSYAKVLLVDDEPAVYAQFGPLSAYPRAQRVRDLYPQLPDAPLPAVITCIATTAAVRGQGLARELVDRVCDDLGGRGFAAVEAYPEIGAAPDATSAATPGFWLRCGFALAVDDPRYPVVRRELG